MRTLHNQLLRRLSLTEDVKVKEDGMLVHYNFKKAFVEEEKELPLSTAILQKLPNFLTPKRLVPDAIVTLDGVTYMLEITHKHKDSAKKVAYYDAANLGRIRINVSGKRDVSELEDSEIEDFFAHGNSVTIEPAKKINIPNIGFADSVFEADASPDGYFVLGIKGETPIKMSKKSFSSGEYCFEDVFGKEYDPQKTFLENMNAE